MLIAGSLTDTYILLMKTRLLCLDIDGTITSGKFSIPERNKIAIQTAIDQGIHVLFSTGRGYSYTKPILEQFTGTFYAALQNGTALYKEPSGTLLNNWDFQREDGLKIINWLLSHGTVNLMAVTGKEDNDHLYFLKGEDYGKYFNRIISSYPKRAVGLKNATDFKKLNIRVIAVIDKKPIIADLSNRITAEYPSFSILPINDPWDTNCSWLNILSLGASKATALKYLSDKLEIPKQEIAAAGNDLNDLEMLRYAGKAVRVGDEKCMLNDGFKKIADPSDEGIADWLERFILN